MSNTSKATYTPLPTDMESSNSTVSEIKPKKADLITRSGSKICLEEKLKLQKYKQPRYTNNGKSDCAGNSTNKNSSTMNFVEKEKVNVLSSPIKDSETLRQFPKKMDKEKVDSKESDRILELIARASSRGCWELDLDGAPNILKQGNDTFDGSVLGVTSPSTRESLSHERVLNCRSRNISTSVEQSINDDPVSENIPNNDQAADVDDGTLCDYSMLCPNQMLCTRHRKQIIDLLDCSNDLQSPSSNTDLVGSLIDVENERQCHSKEPVLDSETESDSNKTESECRVDNAHSKDKSKNLSGIGKLSNNTKLLYKIFTGVVLIMLTSLLLIIIKTVL